MCFSLLDVNSALQCSLSRAVLCVFAGLGVFALNSVSRQDARICSRQRQSSRTYYPNRVVSSSGGKMRNPGIAAVLSFFIPGIGQIYNGKILRGIFWLIVSPGVWIGTGGLFGWVCHIISAATAY